MSLEKVPLPEHRGASLSEDALHELRWGEGDGLDIYTLILLRAAVFYSLKLPFLPEKGPSKAVLGPDIMHISCHIKRLPWSDPNWTFTLPIPIRQIFLFKFK